MVSVRFRDARTPFSSIHCDTQTRRVPVPGPGTLLDRSLGKLSPSRSFAPPLPPPRPTRRPAAPSRIIQRRAGEARAVRHGDADGGRGLQGPHPRRCRSSSHHRHRRPHQISIGFDAISPRSAVVSTPYVVKWCPCRDDGVDPAAEWTLI